MIRVLQRKLRFILLGCTAAAAIAGAPAASTAAQLNLETRPLYLGNAAIPNIMFTIDDSGSMNWNYMPDQINNINCKDGNNCSAGEPPWYSADYNRLYYDPNITYSPAVDFYGNPLPSMNRANTTNWTSVKDDGIGDWITPAYVTTTTNLTNSTTDTEWCGSVPYTVTVTQSYLLVYDGSTSLSSNGNLSIDQNSGKIVAQFDAGHGLSTGDLIDVYSGGNPGCSGSYQGTHIEITKTSSSKFTYADQGSGTGNRRCVIERPGGTFTVTRYHTVCLRHGIDTNNPFEYRTPPSGESYLVHGLPADIYTSPTNINTNPFFYKIMPIEYCSDSRLTSCVATSGPVDVYTYPAPVRWCNSSTNANADAPVSDPAKCQGLYSSTFNKPRYGKFYREDIIDGYTYANVTVDGYTVIDRSGRTDCYSAPTCTYDEEMTNYANWFSYYSNRLSAMKTGVGQAFADLPGDNLRIGFGRINQPSQTVDGVSSPGGTIVQGVRTFLGSAKSQWFDDLYNTYPKRYTSNQMTPLRRALDDMGQYYSRDDSRGPWSTHPEDAASTEATSSFATCRQSYGILSSDGYWNSDAAASPRNGNVDQNEGHPYSDSVSSTLADVAMYYWKNDLSSINNDVPKNSKDTADWQHMVTFTLGLGVKGTLDPDSDLPALKAGTKSWPSASSNQIDDMWHAAVNGRGSFFSADNTTELIDSLRGVFKDITDRTSSAASVAIDTAVTQTTRSIYQARFYTGDWTGTVKAFELNLDTGAIGAETWDAQAKISAQNYDTGRFIATWDAGLSSGTEFRWGTLTAAQQTALNKDAAGTTDGLGSSRLNYIRGQSVAGFRRRDTGVVGDIVHSSPIYVGAPSRSYTSASYYTFKTGAAASRTPMIYVGANDGMMHAIKAADGTEAFAYVPNAVFGNLPKLTTTSFTHQYFVDGPITVEDIEPSAGSWKTVLVGTLGNGGKAVYALDVTNPTLTSGSEEADLAGKVLWEFTDNDLGYVHGEVAVAKMANGEWAAIFGNGYNSTDDGTGNGKATLFIVNADTGATIKKLQVGNGTVADPYGMAAPLPVDVNGDLVVDYIYVGDQEGKIWKFDVTSSSTSNWDSAYKTAIGSTPVYLYQALDAYTTDVAAKPQPITTRVEVGRHPMGSSYGYMVYFGTGKYLEPSDNSRTGQQTQSFYGIWDNAQWWGLLPGSGTVFGRQHLLEQTIDYQLPGDAYTRAARVTSNHPVTWYPNANLPSNPSADGYLGWFIDLQNPANGNANEGERVNTNPLLSAGKIIFASFLVPQDVCAGGGDSWIMELDAGSGSRLENSVWDINYDTSIDGSDFVDTNGDGVADTQVSGTKSEVGAVASPTVVSLPGGQREIKLLSGSTGTVETVHEAPGSVAKGRQSWIRLK